MPESRYRHRKPRPRCPGCARLMAAGRVRCSYCRHPLDGAGQSNFALRRADPAEFERRLQAFQLRIEAELPLFDGPRQDRPR